MESGMKWEEVVKEHGFYETTPCMCGGIKNRKFRKKTYVVYIRESKKLFKLKKGNQTVVPLTNLSELETKLSEIFHVQEA
jgi:hypothetical protein